MDKDLLLKLLLFFRASLVAQWQRIHLPMQETRVQSLIQEDPTCQGAAKPMCHNYWACALKPGSRNSWAWVLQLLSPGAATAEPRLQRLSPGCNCWARVLQPLSPGCNGCNSGIWSLCSSSRGVTTVRSLCATTGEKPELAVKTQHSQHR